MRIFLLKIISVINKVKGIIYFIFKLTQKSSIARDFFNSINNFYISFLTFFITLFYLSFLIYLIVDGTVINGIGSLFLNFQTFVNIHFSLFIALSSIIGLIIYFLYFEDITNFIIKNLVNGIVFGILIGVLSSLIFNQGGSSTYNFLAQYLIIPVISFIFFIWIIHWEIKKIINMEDKRLSGIYYLRTFKKAYTSTYDKKYDNYKNIKEFFGLKFKHYNLYIKEHAKNNIAFQSNTINPINDDPITLGGDIFGYDLFTKSIYDIINGINSSELKGSYSIGIVGEWGQGKSSIINLLHDNYIDSRNDFIFYKFIPWNYKKESVLEKFLLGFSNKLNQLSISKQISAYLVLLSEVDSKFKFLLQFVNLFSKNETIDDIKEKINSYLISLNKKIIIVIDDLDRCEPDEVIMMLNIVKNLGDFKNVIYLVSYDKKHITTVLEQKGFEGVYIDKIMNIEKYLIKPRDMQIENYFFQKLQEILRNIPINLTADEYVSLIKKYDAIFKSENLRFIKKLLNHVNLVLQLESNKQKSVNFNLDDIYNLILINYIKLKDYIFFSNAIYIFYNALPSIEFDKLDMPLVTNKINEDYKKFFIREFLGISITSSQNNGVLRVRSNYSFLLEGDQFDPNSEEGIRKFEILKHNIDFINNFS